MTSTIHLERMRWWHLPEVMRIEREVFPDTAWTEGQYWNELARVPHREYVVALSADDVVGYVGLNVMPPDCDIQTIAVSAAAQRQGLGRRLMDLMLNRAISRGCQQMFLEVREDNHPAFELYRRLGFEQLQIRRDYYGPGRNGIVMRKVLV